MAEHAWSGWPGCICTHCGQEDQREVCLALNCPNALRCAVDGRDRPDPDCDAAGHLLMDCPEHRNGPCLVE